MDIVIRYVFKHRFSGNIEIKHYSTSQLEAREAKKLSPCFDESEYELIARNLCSRERDKEGDRIADGDIIKFVFNDGGENIRLMQIIFDGIAFKMKEINRNYWLEKNDGVLQTKRGILTDYKGDIKDLYKGNDFYSLEVVGNIYQNPDLLLETEGK
ncbi:hypothetical protein H9S87_18940 (plasmid) [Bacillus pumilus]|uniref:hypothetical protein n=1 Tax=Bacillus pumilus TaxID=1408 RepID=UPI00165808B3|nr:hypothetical protein [Bacillus pumilus]QNP18251.1 hypothetical protein H9S87_18940 [Bacillus pumilus]